MKIIIEKYMIKEIFIFSSMFFIEIGIMICGINLIQEYNEYKELINLGALFLTFALLYILYCYAKNCYAKNGGKFFS